MHKISWDELPPFNLEAALKKKPYIHIVDYNCPYGAISEKLYNEVVLIPSEENPAIAVWVGEWIVYRDEEDAQEQLRMYPVVAKGALYAVSR